MASIFIIFFPSLLPNPSHGRCDYLKMGFFAEAGPVQIFVSNHVKIQKDTEVRLKIIGTRVDATEIALIKKTNLNPRKIWVCSSYSTLER
ncbi:hypothetical protein SLE2022_105710 [Rubroshorea leprosula]